MTTQHAVTRVHKRIRRLAKLFGHYSALTDHGPTPRPRYRTTTGRIRANMLTGRPRRWYGGVFLMLYPSSFEHCSVPGQRLVVYLCNGFFWVDFLSLSTHFIWTLIIFGSGRNSTGSITVSTNDSSCFPSFKHSLQPLPETCCSSCLPRYTF